MPPLPFCRLKQHCKQAADEFHSQGLQRKCLAAWLHHTHREVAKAAACELLLGAAEQHCSSALLRKVLRTWHKYSSNRPRRWGVVNQKATQLQQQYLLQRTWRRWLGAIKLRKRLKAGKKVASSNFTRTLLRAWQQQAAGRQAVMHEVLRRFADIQRQLLANVLARWRLYLKLRLRKAAATEVARVHWRQMLLRRCICGWADMAEHCKQRRRQLAVQQHIQKLQVRGWDSSMQCLHCMPAGTSPPALLCQ
jgi:hypothetical protein